MMHPIIPKMTVALKVPVKAIINVKNKIMILIELQPSTILAAYTSTTKNFIDNSDSC